MLLLVLQPLILYCVNNKVLAIKLNRRCVIFLQSSELVFKQDLKITHGYVLIDH